MSHSVKVTGFDHTRVYVSDMERSRRFYEDVLDLQVYAENPRQDSEGIGKIFGRKGAAVQLTFGLIGGHIVELIKVLDTELPRPPKEYVGGSGFTVTVLDVDAAFQACKDAGVTILYEVLEV